LNIALTGASGFVGRYLAAALSEKQHNLRLLLHKRPNTNTENKNITTIYGDVDNVDSLTEAFENIEVVYHLVGIIAETRELTFEKTVTSGTKNIVSASRKCGVKKIIYLSALGTGPMAASKYHRTKWMAEEAVRNSGLDYNIFRPSVIFGEGDGFVSMLSRMIKLMPIIPLIGRGEFLLQPIFIDDLILVMVESLQKDRALNKTIEIGGSKPLKYGEIVGIIKRVLQKRRGTIYLPMWFIKINARILEKIMKPAPLTTDQLLMMKAGNICDNQQLKDIFEIEPITFEDGLKTYLR
jgi:NADH dehydrogenase